MTKVREKMVWRVKIGLVCKHITSQTIHLNLHGLLFPNPGLAGVHGVAFFAALPRPKAASKAQLQAGPVSGIKPGLRALRVGSSQFWATLSGQTKQPKVLPNPRDFFW